MTLYDAAWIFLIYGFVGWCCEVAFAAIVHGRFVNRGFLNGPICPIYGVGALAVVLLLSPLRGHLVLLFLAYFGTTRAFGWNLTGETSSIIVFTLWGTAEMSDLVRGALISIPKHQYESSEALGLSKAQTYWYIIIPQTIRRLLPLSINLITRMIKTTSLILMIGVVEMLKVAQQIIEANRTASPNAAFGVYLTVFLLYFIACWPISLLAKHLEQKWR